MAIDFRLYLITDRHATKKPLIEAVRLALEGGVRAIQLREKDMPVRELLALAKDMRQLTKEFQAKLFINDRVDVAVNVDADGVHVGHSSIPVDAVRSIVGSGMLIGASTHNKSEAITAQDDGADFVTFGPIFETPSKKKYGAPVGLCELKELKKNINIPIFGLGGIKCGNIIRVIGCGADGISMISAILAAEDVKKAAENILEAMRMSDKAICECCAPRE
ncbi:MAG: thiamine phosphate synthase [Nitrospirota bacterium]|nr:thiamine phosphate synthase [Nitrospirota bacterium]